MIGFVGNARNGCGGTSAGDAFGSAGLWEPDFWDGAFGTLFGTLKIKNLDIEVCDTCCKK